MIVGSRLAHQARGGTSWQHLRRCRRSYWHRFGPPSGHERFDGRRIRGRSAGVAKRWRVGGWEGDTIVGEDPARIVTLVDRKSGLARLQRVPDGKAETIAAAVLRVLYPLKARVHTITCTWDNGSELAPHALIGTAPGAESYFADLYSAWQRGCDENLNGQRADPAVAPKGCDLSTLGAADAQRIEAKPNSRPPKRYCGAGRKRPSYGESAC